MKYLLLIPVLLLMGCRGDGKATKVEAAMDKYEPEFLFQTEGCKVYRFVDGTRVVYFTNCHGDTQWTESCGKNCQREVGVKGGI